MTTPTRNRSRRKSAAKTVVVSTRPVRSGGRRKPRGPKLNVIAEPSKQVTIGSVTADVAAEMAANGGRMTPADEPSRVVTLTTHKPVPLCEEVIAAYHANPPPPPVPPCLTFRQRLSNWWNRY